MFAAVILAFGALILFSQSKPRARGEVIKFSHKYHLVEAEAECSDCHAKVADSQSGTDNLLPTMDDCGNCHDVEAEDECSVCHFEDEDTQVALESKPHNLNFNHKAHLAGLDLTCQSCHKNLAKVDFANSASLPSMKECADCHNNQQASLECATCHTSALNLRPADHSADFLVSHKNFARMDQDDCATCHAESDCSECHDGAILTENSFGKAGSAGGVDVQSPLVPSGRGTKALRLERIHELNFRMTHPQQAQARTKECAVCHETSNFCQTCHEAEGVDVSGKPAWHGGADWGAVAGAVGSGGGRHAALAKRDIENCASCHSTQGDDPTCLLCHTDFDDALGTDPKTHDSGFANRFGEGDSFHDDDNALCYSCHVKSDNSPTGFCGSYCHELKN